MEGIIGLDSQINITPETTGIYLIGAGSWVEDYGDGEVYGVGDITVTITPPPMEDPLPNQELVYETSSGFNNFGKPIKYRSAELAGCGNSNHYYKSNNLVSLITKKSLEYDNITNQQTFKNISTLNFDGIDDYLVVKYPFYSLSEFTFAIKFNAFSNGVLVGINDDTIPPNSCSSYCPFIYILNDGFEVHIWNNRRSYFTI